MLELSRLNRGVVVTAAFDVVIWHSGWRFLGIVFIPRLVPVEKSVPGRNPLSAGFT